VQQRSYQIAHTLNVLRHKNIENMHLVQYKAHKHCTNQTVLITL